MSKFLYTVVCRYVTKDGIIEMDLYEVFKNLNIKPYIQTSYGQLWNHRDVINYNVRSGQAVEYLIKRVSRDIKITEETKYFYSPYEPYSIMYDCRFDLKDVRNMNEESINIRMSLTDKEFDEIYIKK